MAVTLRVLFHTTGNSTSLLSHLNATATHLITSCDVLVSDLEPDGMLEGGLTMLASNGNGWEAKLNRETSYHLSPFETWWKCEAVSAYGGHVYTRKKIVLDTAHIDGGAHVALHIPKQLEQMREGPWRVVKSGTNPMVTRYANQHFQYIRQIAYEVLHSDEILDLVKQGFRLATDNEIRKNEEVQRMTVIASANVLLDAGNKLLESGSREDAHNLAIQGLDRLQNVAGRDTLETFGRLYWLLVSTYEKSDHINRKEAYLKLVNEYDRFTKGVLKPGIEAEIYVKTHYCLADHLRSLDEYDAAKNSYRLIYDITRQFFETPGKRANNDDFEPLFYMLASMNNLGVFQLNHADYDSVKETILTLKQDLGGYSIELFGSSSCCEIHHLFEAVNAKKLIHEIVKSQANYALALIGKGDHNGARNAIKSFDDMCVHYSDEYVETRRKQIQDGFDWLAGQVGA